MWAGVGLQHQIAELLYAARVSMAHEDEAEGHWAARTASSLKLNAAHVRRFGQMLAEGSTVPFIVRYRGPSVGGMSGAADELRSNALGQRCRPRVLVSASLISS